MELPQLPPAPKSALYSLRLIQSHYNLLIEEYEDKISHYQSLIEQSLEQLHHAQALLDKIEPAGEMVDGLIEICIKKDEELELNLDDRDTPDNVLPQWQDMPRLEAVCQIFEANKEKVLHPEFIAHQLYGVVPEESKNIILDRVRNILNRGKRKDLWFKVPNSGGCYAWSRGAIAS